MQVELGQTKTVTVVLTNRLDGSPITGVSASDIAMNIRKEGGTLASKAIDGNNFQELSPTAAPGLYEISFSAADLDTPGEFIAVILENASIDLDQTVVLLDVVEHTNDALGASLDAINSMTTEALGLSQKNYRITNQSYNSQNGKLESATIEIYASASDMDQGNAPSATYLMSATFDGQGKLTNYEVKDA